MVKRLPEQRSEEKWNTLTFGPSNGFKMEEDGRKVIGGEDGLFVGTPLPLAPGNVNRLKERIFKESGSESPWFAGDGNLVLSDPYRPYPLQLLNEIDDTMRRLVIFRPAEVNQMEHIQHRYWTLIPSMN